VTRIRRVGKGAHLRAVPTARELGRGWWARRPLSNLSARRAVFAGAFAHPTDHGIDQIPSLALITSGSADSAFGSIATSSNSHLANRAFSMKGTVASIPSLARIPF
jgi:hypothetical protein